MAPRPTSPITSIRMSSELAHELERVADSGLSRSEAINRFAVEGMRMAAHPGIVFRDGPAGRRPGLFAGPDVWEVARVLRDVKPRGQAAIEATSKLTGCDRSQVVAVAGYYAAYKAEIDTWIQAVDDAADRHEREWREREAILA